METLYPHIDEMTGKMFGTFFSSGKKLQAVHKITCFLVS